MDQSAARRKPKRLASAAPAPANLTTPDSGLEPALRRPAEQPGHDRDKNERDHESHHRASARARLFELEQRKKKEELEKFSKDKKDIAWGSQIRSYVLQPYQMVKDHRTGVEAGNTGAVLDGAIDEFIQAYLMGVRKGDADSMPS